MNVECCKSRIRRTVCLLAALGACGNAAHAGVVNDNCANAIPISNGATPFSTVGATTDGPSHVGCQFDGQTYNDIWYTYTATCTGNLTVSTCNTAAYDTDLVVYNGCDCANLSLLECNDDGAGCAGFSSEVTVPVSAGNCYLVRVGGFQNGSQGTGTVTLSCAVPGNGACCHPDDSCTFGTIQQCIDTGGVFSEGVLCDPNPCLIAGADIVYNNIGSITNYGAIGGIRGYALGSFTCNIGDQGLEWANDGTPGLAMNAFRLNSGRLEQIGLSWVKHACCVSNGACDMTCSPTGIGLRPGCRDVYSAGWNGGQSRLGARSDINPFAGTVPPSTGGTGNAIYKRLQIAETDLQQTPEGALYFVEGLYICTDDAVAGNALNNASYKQVTVDGGFNLIETGTMHETVPAIYAWQDNVPSVEVFNVDVPGEGRFILGTNAVDNGDGTWRYTYAVYNLNSHRSAGSLSIPIQPGTSITNVGFHDVDYHSGEPFDGTDWDFTVAPTTATWFTTQTHAQNPNANALRWGTLYTFWLDANAAPTAAAVTIGLFRPGSPDSITATVSAPGGAAGGEVPIPTVTTWGLMAMILCLLTTATLVYRRWRIERC